MRAPDDDEDDDGAPDEGAAPARLLSLALPPEAAGSRLDRALAEAAARAAPELAISRSRLQALAAEGALTRLDAGGASLAELSRKVKGPELWSLALPPPAPARPQPEDIPLRVVYEDAHLIVVDKPAGMAVHPAPGCERGTLVNALLSHCGDSLSGVGGERRPGIVHRIDKDTSGLLVVAKTDAAHQALAARFAAHDIERAYLAVCHGHIDAADARLRGLPGVSFEAGGLLRIDAPIARHPADRKRMAVAKAGGRRAVTRARTLERFESASLIECRLETGRTHQIRVHMAHVGRPLWSDPVYGSARRPPQGEPDLDLGRQALHAARLGFIHPASGEPLRFESVVPPDMERLITRMRTDMTKN